jgi:hypothetical protein
MTVRDIERRLEELEGSDDGELLRIVITHTHVGTTNGGGLEEGEVREETEVIEI